MKNLLVVLFAFFTLFSIKDCESQEITSDVVEKYLKFLTVQEKSFMYEVTIHQNDSVKKFVRLGHNVDSYSIVIPELNIDLKAPESKGLRVENGVVWVGKMKTSFDNVASINIHKKTLYDNQGNIISEEMFSESPTIVDTIIGSDIDQESKDFLNATIEYIKHSTGND